MPNERSENGKVVPCQEEIRRTNKVQVAARVDGEQVASAVDFQKLQHVRTGCM